jgi:hypothetical protein
LTRLYPRYTFRISHIDRTTISRRKQSHAWKTVHTQNSRLLAGTLFDGMANVRDRRAGNRMVADLEADAGGFGARLFDDYGLARPP